MKRKVLVLTMGVICATQLWHSNHANALVTESGANDTKQFTEIVSEEKVITVEHAQINIFQSNSNSNLMEFNILTMGGKSGAMVVIVKLTHHISQTVTNALLDVIMLKKHKA
ncbi:von Willebrand binding protein [Staphylococcus aureus]|uniref:von Willebrand binding protein n=1 Tax=Staphylococcus aureus TaxID=1280 RepID=A0A380EF55_STAAU|nr:von Willebrand binding protein [Staphylococcus aureus]